MEARRIALVQFDAVPEQPDRNLAELERLARKAAAQGSQIVMFHEGTLCDYTPRVAELSEEVPGGPSCKRVEALAIELGCFISFGLSEKNHGLYHITQVFCGPLGFIYRYRKTWIWHEPVGDEGYRDEWSRYDPGDGPELFEIAGLQATCFICADGEAPRCIERASSLRPDIVFYPNNRGQLPDHRTFGRRAEQIGAPMLVSNRTGVSWVQICEGGCAVYDAAGRLLGAANREGREEILVHDLEVPRSARTAAG